MSEPEASDADLVQRMARGDQQALAALYQRHAARLLGLALAMLSDRAEAEDLLHDVFLEAWRHSHDYAESRGTVRAWLTTRTRSRALDRIKSTARRRNVPSDAASPTESPTLNLSDHQRLRQVLEKLPETQTEVVLLAYFGDLTSSEIAERLGIPIGTVKSRLRAALAGLRQVLGGDERD